jgi:hypothetical protein
VIQFMCFVVFLFRVFLINTILLSAPVENVLGKESFGMD